MKTSTITFRILTLVFFIFFMGKNVHSQVAKDSLSHEMSNKKMDAIFKSETELVEGELGNWQMLYGGIPVFVLTDEKNNRMRIFTPVLEEKELEEGQLKKMLEANFHSALDSKYSLYNGFVVSVYTHPLKELQEDQLIDAMRQVVTLSKTFGDSYTSTGLIFGAGQSEEEKEESKKKKKKAKKM